MRWTPIVGLAAALVIALASAPAASASRLLTMRHDGSTVVRDDPYLPPAQASAHVPAAAVDRHRERIRSSSHAAASSGPRLVARAARPRSTHHRRTVRGELKRLLAAKAISRADYDADRSIYFQARRTRSKLSGTRRSALSVTITTLEHIAAAGRLTSSRVPELFETVRRNREWWANGRLLGSGERVGFAGSQLVWQYYPGEGLQIQWLGTFGKANALWSATKQDAALRSLLDEALTLAVKRAGGIAWEYLFHFDGGSPPWVSGIAQGTAIQALARSGAKLGDPRYTQAAHAALGVFHHSPPTGVRVKTPAGAHYLIYSFARGMRVLNAFTQSLNGLYDYTSLTNDPDGRELFKQGENQLRSELHRYDTGAWSYYSPGVDADVSYHTLARDFLRNLCTRLTRDGKDVQTGAPATGGAVAAAPLAPVDPGVSPAIYCSAADRFTAYLKQPPKLELLSRAVRAGRPALVKLRVSKPSFVKLALSRNGKIAAVLTANVSGGRRTLRWSQPRVAGTYDVAIRATDLPGNDGSAKGTLRVLPARHR